MSLERDLGAHDEAIDTLKADMKSVKDSLARMEKQLATAQGGLRMLIAVGSVGGAVGAGVVKALGYLKGTGI